MLKLARYYFKKASFKPLLTFDIEHFFKAVEQWSQDPDCADAIWGLIELEHTANPEFTAVQTYRWEPTVFTQALVETKPMSLPAGIVEFLDYTYGPKKE